MTLEAQENRGERKSKASKVEEGNKEEWKRRKVYNINQQNLRKEEII